MHKDLEVTIEVYRAFNRWVEDQWGFAYQDRIFGVPYIITSDPDQMVDELQWCLDHGARVDRDPPRRGGHARRAALTGRPDVRRVLGSRAGVGRRGDARTTVPTPPTPRWARS